MVTDPDAALDRLREQLDGGERDVDDADRGLLLAFDDRMALLKSDYSTQRREKLLRHCTILSEEVGGLAEALEDREVAEDMVR